MRLDTKTTPTGLALFVLVLASGVKLVLTSEGGLCEHYYQRKKRR